MHEGCLVADMEQLKGFVVAGKEHLVCRLRNSIYGLTQATRQWYKKFNDIIQSIGFFKSDEDHYIFSKTARDGSPIFLILYMDDMLLIEIVEELDDVVLVDRSKGSNDLLTESLYQWDCGWRLESIDLAQ